MAAMEEILNTNVSDLCEKAEIPTEEVGAIVVVVMTKHDCCGQYHMPAIITTEDDPQKVLFDLYCTAMYVERAQIEDAAANPN